MKKILALFVIILLSSCTVVIHYPPTQPTTFVNSDTTKVCN